MKAGNKKRKCMVGIDFGTTSLSAIIVDIEGKRILETITYETNAYISSNDSRVKEQSVDILSELFDNLLSEISKLPDTQIISFGFTGQMHGIVGLNENGEAVTNLVTWQDKSGEIILDEGITILEKIKQTTGCTTLANGYGIVTLYKWIAYEKRNDIYTFCTIADYFALRLSRTKEAKMSPGMAHSIGLFDIITDNWDMDAIEKLSFGNVHFPEIVPNNTIIGYSHIPSPNIPVVCAIGDNQASFKGSVANAGSTMLLNVGTGTQLSFQIKKTDYSLFEQYIDGLDTQARPLDNNHFLVATSYINGGSAYKLLFNFFKDVAHSLFRIDDFNDSNLWKNMEQEGWSGLGKTNQLTVFPLFEGQRKSLSDNKGIISNIQSSNFTAGHFISGFLIGLALYYKNGFFPELKNRITYLSGSGNGLKRNKLLVKCIEDAFGYTLALTKYNEEAAFGAALNGGIATDAIDEDFLQTFT